MTARRKTAEAMNPGEAALEEGGGGMAGTSQSAGSGGGGASAMKSSFIAATAISAMLHGRPQLSAPSTDSDGNALVFSSRQISNMSYASSKLSKY